MRLRRSSLRWILPLLLIVASVRPATAQTFPFTSGPIPMCDTTIFTANVAGVGTLIIPDGYTSGYWIQSLLMNITTDHPQTLQISLTSPAGTTLLLSAFNGAGGQNYTNTNFDYYGWYNITTGSAPFTGTFLPQGGTFDLFSGENANGAWVITVVDTACANGGTGPGGNWTPGWFDGGAGGGAFAIGFDSGWTPPPGVYMGDLSATLCPGGSVDIMTYFETTFSGFGLVLTANDQYLGGSPADPYAVTDVGYYSVQGWDNYGEMYYGYFNVTAGVGVGLGPDQVVDQCAGTATPVSLPMLLNVPNVTTVWTLDGQLITAAEAANATAPGIYQVIATTWNGCSDTAIVTLNNLPAPVLGADASAAVCSGEVVDLNGFFPTSGLSTAWYLNGAPVAAPNAVSSAGLYTLVATNADGCTDEAAVQVAVSPSPALGPDQSLTRCAGEAVDLYALYPPGTGNAIWSLNGAVIAQPNAVNVSGSYSVIVTTAAGCSDDATVILQFNPTPVLGDDQAVSICAGDGYDLTTLYNTAGLSAVWSYANAPVNDPTAVQVAGNYKLVATNTSNCSDVAIVNVGVNTPLSLGPNQVFNLCSWMHV
ncbi:MAG: proprotein convertase P-domain-containing protein, partial [Flavobacteriales bacterium]